MGGAGAALAVDASTQTSRTTGVRIGHLAISVGTVGTAFGEARGRLPLSLQPVAGGRLPLARPCGRGLFLTVARNRSSSVREPILAESARRAGGNMTTE